MIKRVPREEQGKKARPQPRRRGQAGGGQLIHRPDLRRPGGLPPPRGLSHRPCAPAASARGPAPRAAPAGPGSPAWGEPSRARGTGSAANFPRRPAEAGCPTQPGDPGPGFLRAPAQRAGRCPASRPAKAGACSQARGSSPAGGSPPAPRPAESAPAPQPARQQPARPAANTQPPRRASHVVRSVEIPDFSEDFFKKYDDPAYVERRLKELEEKQNKG